MNTKREAFLSLIASDKAYYEPILAAAKKECKELSSSFYDDKELIAGWGHNFVCADCGGNLIFDMSLKNPRGKSFTCSVCKKEASGKKKSAKPPTASLSALSPSRLLPTHSLVSSSSSASTPAS